MKVILRRSLRRGGFVILLAAASWVVAMPAVAQDQSPTASGVPSGPSVSTSPIALPESGVLDRRSYYVDAGPDIAPARFSFSVPSGWVSYEGGVTNGVGLYPSRGWEAEAGFETWIVSHVFSDACHHTTLVDVGTTVDELAAALAAQQGVVASGPTDVTVAGHPAKRVELTVPRDLDVATCENSRIRFWPGPGPDMTSGMCCIFGPGGTVVVDVADVESQRWVVVTRHGPKATADDLTSLDSLLASIRIDAAIPDTSPMSPSPAP